MALLSFFMSLSLPLCILLNLIVPFLLVFLQTSQFNQLGYFANAMCFVFLQLRACWPGGAGSADGGSGLWPGRFDHCPVLLFLTE